MFRLWQGWWGRRGDSKTRRRAARRTPQVLPRVEGLEDRCLPSVLFGGPANKTVSDNNGLVINNARVDLIFWGSAWTAAEQSLIQTAVDAILQGPYVTAASQYRGGIGQGSRVNSYGITDTSPPSHFTIADVQDFLLANIKDFNAAGPVTESPTTTPDIFYFVVTQPGSSDPTERLGGFHSYLTDNTTNYHYGWTINTGATAAARLDTVTEVFTHELIEAVTDPEGTAVQVKPRNASNWNEVADGPAQRYAYRVGGYLEQSYLSVRDNAYVVPDGNGQNVQVSAARVLTVNGDQLADKDDTIVVRRSTAGGIEVVLNGETFSFDAGAVRSVTIKGLTGDDSVTVDGTNGAVGVPVSFDGGTGTNTLTGPDGVNTWTVTAQNKGAVTGVVSFTNVQNLTGGGLRDVFAFSGRGGVDGKVDGGGGSNWLNYSGVAGKVAVNLTDGVAARIGNGVARIDNVIGSAGGGDTLTGSATGGVLVGHRSGNALTPGAGRSVLIGGFGRNTLTGGPADDLLVNGRTRYDGNQDALEAVLGVWQGTGDYNSRVAALAAAEPQQLKVGTTVFVFGTARKLGTMPESVLTGNAGMDWFITNAARTVTDQEAGEVVTTS